MAEPMIKLEPNGRAPTLSYNVPEPTSYTGRQGISLEFDGDTRDWFKDDAFKVPERTSVEQLAEAGNREILDALTNGNLKVFPGIKNPSVNPDILFSAQAAVEKSDGTLDTATTSSMAHGLHRESVRPRLEVMAEANPNLRDFGPSNLPPAVRAAILSTPALADQSVRPSITDLSVADIAAALRNGKRLSVLRSIWGDYVPKFLPEPAAASPALVLIETYRLSSFLGQYGAGRTVKTFSLLPGEKTTISIKTFLKSETDRKSASSILDSFSKESSDDFETSILEEQTDKQTSQKSFEYHAEAEAKASWGWGSAKVSGGVKGGTASQREEFAKNVSNAVSKHTAKASSKRDVQVNTSSEVRMEAGEETSITRELENINAGRVLNFVFRQMNQEHIALLHLVDVRVAFFNGYSESVDEVALPRLDSLLKRYINEQKREEVKAMIVNQLETIFDYNDEPIAKSFVETRKLDDGDSYLRVRRGLASTYTDETGNSFTVPGVIVSASKIVMRTDGIVVDAILGQGDALDEYSAKLQHNAVEERRLENERLAKQLARDQLATQIISDGDEAKAALLERLLPSSISLPGRLGVSTVDGNVTLTVSPHFNADEQ